MPLDWLAAAGKMLLLLLLLKEETNDSCCSGKWNYLSLSLQESQRN
jgi:hypothetical protein